MISRLVPLTFLALSTQLFACIGTVQPGDVYEDDEGGAGAGNSTGNGTATTGNGSTGSGSGTSGGAPPASGGNGSSTGAANGSSTGGSNGSSTGAGASSGGSSGASSGGSASGGTTGSSTGASSGGSTGPVDAGVPDAGGDEDAGDPVDPIDQSIMRGAGIYPAMCGGCHGADGSGGRANEPLTSYTSVPQLSAIIDREMPPGNPNACSATCAEDVARYIIATF